MASGSRRALASVRQLVLASTLASAEYVDVDVGSDSLTFRDNGVPRHCPGTLSKSAAQGDQQQRHSACDGNALRCKQASEYQEAALVRGDRSAAPQRTHLLPRAAAADRRSARVQMRELTRPWPSAACCWEAQRGVRPAKGDDSRDDSAPRGEVRHAAP